jgi:hypothetical protein
MTLSMFRNDLCAAGDIGSGGSVATLLRTKKTVFTHKQREREREREAQLSLSLLVEITLAPGYQPLRPSSSEACLVCGPAHFFVYRSCALLPCIYESGCTCE